MDRPNGLSFLLLMDFTARQHHQLMAQAQPPTTPERSSSESYDIVKALPADLCTGWGFRNRGQREHWKEIIKRDKLKLLARCPPCTWAGGWWHQYVP